MLTCVAATAVAAACSDDTAQFGTSTGSGAGGATADGGAGGSGASPSGGLGGSGATGGTGTARGGAGGGADGGGAGVPPPPTEIAACGNQVYDCGDLQDNDGDGLIDYQDPDCLGPCDNTEDSFYPDLPGMSGQNCDLDCFWDQGQGHDENCYWDHHCDPFADTMNTTVHPQTGCGWDSAMSGPVADQIFPPSPLTCDEMFNAQPQTCIDQCLPLAPNGCDCFGCCELQNGSGVTVWLGSTDDATNNGSCTIEDLGTPNFLDECHPCVQVPGCNNPCDTCELCIGKYVLPPECSPDEQCDSGVQPCGLADQDPCPSGQYCITGCCVEVPS